MKGDNGLVQSVTWTIKICRISFSVAYEIMMLQAEGHQDPMLLLEKDFTEPIRAASRSQLPRGLSHELSSLVRTLGSWVRIQLKA
jgi:hypothetical protein